MKHGLNIGVYRIDDQVFLKIKLCGKLTHEDYKTMIPLIESSLTTSKSPNIKVLIDAIELDGWEMHALWDDFKFGIKHNKEFSKLAFVGNKKWQDIAVSISSWFMSGQMKYFQDVKEAQAWLSQEDMSNTTHPTKDIVQKELFERKNDIKDSLENLFKSNLRITDWNVAEADDQKASEMILDIFQEKLDELKVDVKNKKFENY